MVFGPGTRASYRKPYLFPGFLGPKVSPRGALRTVWLGAETSWNEELPSKNQSEEAKREKVPEGC